MGNDSLLHFLGPIRVIIGDCDPLLEVGLSVCDFLVLGILPARLEVLIEFSCQTDKDLPEGVPVFSLGNSDDSLNVFGKVVILLHALSHHIFHTRIFLDSTVDSG